MSKTCFRSLPRNVTDRTRVLQRLHGAVRNDSVSPEVASLPTEGALPIRQFFSWPGKRNYEGMWWSSTNRAHVEFESLLEREYLLAADVAVEVVGIAAQPLALLWPHNTMGQRDHVPDFFVRLGNGDGRLIDVRHPDRVEKSAAQFALTRAVCNEIGWQYELFTGLPRDRSQNLRWLAGYRQDRHAPDGATAEAIRHCFTTPVTLQTGLRQASTSTGQPLNIVTANVLHLLWRQLLSADLGTPLSMNSEVWA
jgi:hypothetical protein